MSATIQRRLEGTVRHGYLEDFYCFAKEVLGYRDLEEVPHREMVEFLVAAATPSGTTEQKKSMLLVPRNCFKTTLASIALPLWLLAQNPNLRILITTHTHDYSKQILEEIKFHCERNELFRRMFGDWVTGAKEWSEHAMTIALRSAAKKEPSIDTAGVDKARTGGHYDVVIADDLQNEKNIDSESVRIKVRRHLQTLLPILKPGGVFILIGTRWAPNDCYGWIIERDQLLEKRDRPSEWRKLIRSAYLEDGSFYFPAVLNQQFLDQQKRAVDDKLFSSWYLNSPMTEGSVIFPQAWWKYFDGEVDTFPLLMLTTEEKTFPVYITMALDPAYSSARRADYAGITIVAFDEHLDWWVLEAERVRGGPVPVLDRLVYWARPTKYGITQMTCETVANQELFRAAIIDRFRRENLQIGVTPYKEAQRRTKEKRIEALQPLFKQGKIHLRRGLSDLYRELEDWPQTEHDDLLDSLAQHFALMRKPRDVWSHARTIIGSVILVDDEHNEDTDERGSTSPAWESPRIGLSTPGIRPAHWLQGRTPFDR